MEPIGTSEHYFNGNWRRNITAGFLAVTLPFIAGCGSKTEQSSGGDSVTVTTVPFEAVVPLEPTITTLLGREVTATTAVASPNRQSLESIVRAGKSLGTFIVPRMCNLAIDIVAMPHEQVNRFGEDTVIDALPVDPNPNPGCQEATDHAAIVRRTQNPSHAARSERTNPKEYRGTANQFVPTAAWDMGSDLPGKPGITVIPGHRTTHTAPFSELDLVRSGDYAEMRLINGDTLRYQAIYNGVLREDDGSVVIPESVSFDHDKSYVVTYGCAPQRSSVFRQVVVWAKQ